MEKFKISDIQEIFVSDVERFHSLTQHYVSQLLNDATPSQEALDEALRQCHTLKGLAGTVEAWGLASLGADLERLLELAGSWVHNERARANEVFEFILDHMQDWYVMNQFTCMEMLPQAWDVYQGLRSVMQERWPGYLPEPSGAESVDAQYVRLPELEISELEPASAEVRAAPANEAGQDDAAAAELKADLDVRVPQLQGASTLAQSGAPLPVRVVPPTLRHRDVAKSGADATVPSAGAKAAEAAHDATAEGAASPVAGSEAAKNLSEPSARADGVNPEARLSDGQPLQAAGQPATPQRLQVVPPVLRRRDVVPESKVEPATEVSGTTAQAESVSVVPTAEVRAAQANSPEAAPTAQTELPPTVALSPASEISPVAPTAQVDANASAAAGTVTPPLLRVAPPALKRRGKKSEGAAVAAQQSADAAAAAAPLEALPVQPLAAASDAAPPSESVAPETLDALSAEAIFAALPETVELSAKTQTPDSDGDLLELLSQEVAGYLTELTSCLTALAGNLAASEPWERARRLFHTIKGTAATFGLDTVSAPAKVAEARCLAAVEEVSARTEEGFEAAVHRAAVVAKALHLGFDAGPLRLAVRAAQADAANAAAVTAAVGAAQANVVALDPEMAGFFINDTRDQIAIIEQAVLRWERLPAGQSAKAAEQVQAAQRGFHTIKGAGNSIGLTAVAQSVHEVEAFLEGVVANGAVGSKGIFTFLLGAVDQLRRYLVALAKNTASPWRHDWSVALGLVGAAQANGAVGDAPASEATVVSAALSVDSGAEEDAQTLRIETARLYQLMNLISEMVIDRARLARKIEQLAGLHRALAERNGALTGSVLTFQQQFEFNLAAGQGRRGEDGGLRMEDGDKGASSLPASFVHAPAASSGGHGEFSELEFDRYDQFNVLARSLVEISHDIEVLNGEVAACLDSFTAENAQFTQTSQELQAQVTGLGLVPVKVLFPRLQRAFRDACSVEGKDAELVLSGGETMLDKVVVDKVYAPLLHLLRNAVAHGIEDGATRKRQKKSAQGKVRLSAAQSSNQIVLVLTDDGAGVDAAAVRARAIEKGWLAKDAPELSAEQVAAFIFRPGFSTATQVTSVSGRGIGLDVVRKEVENLNGAVELKYLAGEGATWTLRLPLTLAISEAILAEVGGTQFAFPLNFIEAGLILEPESRKAENGVELYPVEQRNVEADPENPELENGEAETGPKFDLLPVWRLSRLFGIAGDENSNKGLVVSVGDRRAIVVVDVVLRRQEVVVKQLDVVMAGHPLLNGASLDAEGRVIPILNLPTLLKFGEQWASGASRGAGVRLAEVKRVEQTRVLVVDDSLSVRKVQERYLRELGCQVTVASDGLVALERLRELEFDLILTDLEMPRLNGYELISEVRGNPAWSAVPMVVISSRGADKYITKAMNLGASTFLSKPFTQEQLRQVLAHYAKG